VLPTLNTIVSVVGRTSACWWRSRFRSIAGSEAVSPDSYYFESITDCFIRLEGSFPCTTSYSDSGYFRPFLNLWKFIVCFLFTLRYGIFEIYDSCRTWSWVLSSCEMTLILQRFAETLIGQSFGISGALFLSWSFDLNVLHKKGSNPE